MKPTIGRGPGALDPGAESSRRARAGTRAPDAGEPPLGLASGGVRLVPWQPGWATLFREEAERIREACGPGVLAVEHIGSTAIPGLPAKPVLDLLAVVPSLDAGRALIPVLSPLGYEFRPDPEIPERIFLRRVDGAGMRTHHLSLTAAGSRFHRVQLCFRDHLRTHPEDAAAYAALKSALAAAHPLDRESYTTGKGEFVREVLRRAGCDGPDAPARG